MMACIYRVTNTVVRDDMHEADKGLDHGFSSSKYLDRRVILRRSYSDNRRSCSIGGIITTVLHPKLKSSRPVDLFNIQSTLSSHLCYHGMNKKTEEIDSEDELDIDKMKKRANWVEILMEFRRCWSGKDNKDDGYNGDGEKICDKEGRDISIDRETFSSFLRRVSWSEIKILSKLAFLSNMAYVIQDIKKGDLMRYYGLEFVTSSLEKKGETTSIEDSAENKDVMQESRGNCEEDDLQSLQYLSWEWFICDDSSKYTRCFVIKGSDSLTSLQEILFPEAIKFEGTDVLVHKGIYEVAKKLYDKFIPEIKQHLDRFNDLAKLQFAGHSLGGSIAMIVNLMLITREEVQQSALLPVVTFGSPFVFFDGEKILNELNLDENHIHSVIMHRDIVPRAFSFNYPDYVARVFKRLTSPFGFRPCLSKNVTTLALCILAVIQRLTSNFNVVHCPNNQLYSPMGKLFILQPAEQLPKGDERVYKTTYEDGSKKSKKTEESDVAIVEFKIASCLILQYTCSNDVVLIS